MFYNLTDKDLDLLLEETMTVSRLIKTGFFRKIPPHSEEIRTELHLFRYVLDKALLDQFDEHEIYRMQSKLWADLDNPDFIETCELAFLNPNDVIKGFMKVTEIFRKNGEDKYYKKDIKKFNTLSKTDIEYYLNYEEPD